MNTVKRTGSLVLILWLLIAAFAALFALRFPSAQSSGFGPGLLPLILAGLLALLAVIDFSVTRKQKVSELVLDDDSLSSGSTWALVAVLVVYLWLLPMLGFISSSTLLSMVSLRLFGYSNVVRSAAISISLAYILYILFSQIMNVPLPTGWLG